MFMYRGTGFAVLVFTFLAAPFEAAPQNAKFANLKFSREEVDLLKAIDKIEKAAGVTESMLKATPFIEIFTSLSPHEMLITVTMNDWDRIGPALKAMGQIKACKVSEEIALFVVENGNDKQKHPNKAFFEQLRKRYDNGCQ
jgi:hypothetical protein